MALTAGSSYITAPMTTTVPGANRKRVGGIEAQEVVVGITEEVEQHLVKNSKEDYAQREAESEQDTSLAVKVWHSFL